MILTWTRLRTFLKRAGIIIIIVVTILGFLNSIGTDGTLGNEDTENSVLSVIGKSITPIFVPMGIEEENWPASVAIFTGLFAKEVVVGTLNGLYMQDIESSNVEEGAENERFDFWGQIIESFVTIPENLKGIGGTLSDPLGFGIVEEDQESLTGELEVAPTTFSVIRERFNDQSARAYAYLLFILIYFPCVAAFGAILKEIGPFYGGLSVTYLTVLAWIVATLFYQLTIGHSVLWISVAIALLLLIVLVFYLLGKRREEKEKVI
jgi:ferrous iron transport protein B